MPSSGCRLALALLFFLVLAGGPAAADPALGKQDGWRAVPESVIDGDTFWVHPAAGGKSFKIRVWGIDTPERDEPGYERAGRALERLVAGETLRCDGRGTSYDRVVAQCFAGGEDVGGRMVAGGFAQDWPRFSGGRYAELETAARESRGGIWAVVAREWLGQ